MDSALSSYIAAAREKGLKDETIKSNLVIAGWDADLAAAALSADLSFPAPTAPARVASHDHMAHGPGGVPIAVVSNFTTRGLEYIIMFIALAVAATSLGFLLHDTVDTLSGVTGSIYGGVVSYATAALIVGLPIFLILFLRLKSAEIKLPSLYDDPSRKRAVQLTLIITFIIGIWKIISYIYSLLNSGSSDSFSGTTSITGNLTHTLITLGIAGGIFAYYWYDSHHKGNQ